jgi:DNA topoisomerase-1
LIDAPIIKKVTEKKIVTLIQRLGKKADVVTIATDYDTEGELIGKEALEIIRTINAKVPVPIRCVQIRSCYFITNSRISFPDC